MLAFWQVINVLSAICFFAKFIQEHEHQYPRIFKLAMDIIPIQASSVPCERVFSSGKETMAPRRRRISAKLMEALLERRAHGPLRGRVGAEGTAVWGPSEGS
jgi:hypothetical protein